MSDQVGRTFKVDMNLMSGLHAAPYESKFDERGYPHTSRDGDNLTGINTGSFQADQSIPPGQDGVPCEKNGKFLDWRTQDITPQGYKNTPIVKN